MNTRTLEAPTPDPSIEELFALAQILPLAGYALRLRRALEVIAVGGDRLKLQQVARKALAAPETHVVNGTKEAAHG